MDLSRLEFDGKDRRIVFHGDCLEMHPICEAFCCRIWPAEMTEEEYASGRWESETVCILTHKPCTDNTRPCLSRQYQLRKREDGCCVYLDENRCSIYSDRPKNCSTWHCRDHDWVLSPGPLKNQPPSNEKNPTLTCETFVKHMKPNLVFVPHPLLKVHTVFVRKPQHDIIFVKEMVGACGKFTTQDTFDYPRLDDDGVMELIDLFNRKEPLGQIYQDFCVQHPDVLTQQDFFEIVWVLNKHNIVLDSRNFPGMLGGMGGIG